MMRVLLMATLLCACTSSWRIGDPTWTGILKGASAGQLAIHRGSTAYETRFTLQLRGLFAGERVRWRLFEGKCDRPGATVGPIAEIADLVASTSGETGIVTTLGMRIPEHGWYHIGISRADGSRVACAQLERIEPIGAYQREIRYP